MELLIGCLLPATYSAYTDATKRNLYDYITFPMFFLGLIYAVYTGTVLNSLVTAGTVFSIFLFLATKGGVSGGDIKFATALAIWFGFPLAIYVIGLGSLLGFFYGLINLKRLGVLKKRIVPLVKGIYIRVAYGTKNVIPIGKLPENDDISLEAVPFGTFLGLGAWVIFITCRLTLVTLVVR